MAAYKKSTVSKYLLVGYPGTAKTTTGMMLPKPLLVLDLDNNMDGPIEYLVGKKILSDDEMAQITVVKPFFDADNKLVKRADRWQQMCRVLSLYLKTGQFKSVFIDGLSAMTAAALDEIRRQNKFYIAEGDLGDEAMMDKSIDDPLRIQDWGSFVTLLEQLLIRISSTHGVNLAISAHITMRERGKDSDIFDEFIACPSEFRTKIAGLFSECWRFTREDKGAGVNASAEVYLQTVAGNKSQATIGMKSGKQIGGKVLLDLKKLKEELAK